MARGERQVLVNLGEAGKGVNEVRVMGRGKPQKAAPQAERGRGGGSSAALARRLAVPANLREPGAWSLELPGPASALCPRAGGLGRLRSSPGV